MCALIGDRSIADNEITAEQIDVLRAAAEGYLAHEAALERAMVELRAFAAERRVPVAPMASSGNEDPARRLSTRYT